MWEQQLINDNIINSKLEAVNAMGYIPSVFAVIPRLAQTLRDHRLHPLIRSFAAKSLERLHNDRNSFHARDCAAALFNYLYTYQYKQQLFPTQRDSGRGNQPDDSGQDQDDTGIIVPKRPPYWMTSEMIFLKDLLTALSRLRGADGR